ncbi:CDP-alcohol phosphatidyltransferase family protein [Dokdonella sp.]|uniref:CDP-alcohol phosphatidyltransferase family protein n=1 Tax=Dokdonella sp. TaxID=2291710 RepID=UPI00262826F7|nr:CDP-alcohol phosphatidyltransferase family protein [Dokdonella sp.]
MLRHLPNLITGLRILLVVPLCWLIADRRYDAALLVAAVAGASDALDGFLAKHCGWQSWIGGMLDPIADKLLLTAAFLSLWLVGELPLWLVGLIVGRDLVIVAGATAYHWVIGRFDAEPSVLSKLTTAVQILFVLLELLHLSGWLVVAESVRGGLAILTAAVTLASGMHYVVVWGARARRAKRMEKRA